MLKSVGLSTAINGAISATMTTNPTSTMPMRDFRFESSNESHPGMRDRRARSPAATLSGTTSGGVSVGWSCDTLGGPHARVRDEVEHVHDEVRRDHAEREHEQQRLRQRVVVPESRLLERQPRTGVREDELDE